MLMENFTKERLEESNRLKEKACEDAVALRSYRSAVQPEAVCNL